MTTNPDVVREPVNATHRRQGVVLIVNKLARRGLDVGFRDGVNALENFRRRHAASVGEQLAPNVFGHVGVAVQAHEHGGFQVQLGPLDLFVRRRVDQTHQVVHDVPHEIVRLDIVADHVDAKQARVLVARIERVDHVCEFIFRHFLAETTGMIASQTLGAIVTAEHDLHEHERKGVFGGPRGGFKGNGDVGGFVRIELDAAWEV